MDSMFNPETFLDAVIDTPTEKRPPLPVGDYHAIIKSVESRQWTGKADPTKSGVALDVQLEIEIPSATQQELGLEQPTLTLRDSIMLDLTPSNTIDNRPGMNRRLRAYREALDMNKAGDAFSPRKMVGQPLLVKVSHEIYEGQPVERVAGVARL